MKIGKRFTFEAAHQLPGHDGKCQFLHGHTYTLEVTVTGKPKDSPGAPDDGMVVDFGIISKEVKALIDKYLDHKFLNDSLNVPRTTAEWISAWIFGSLFLTLHKRGVILECVRVQEGGGGWAECDHASQHEMNNK